MVEARTIAQNGIQKESRSNKMQQEIYSNSPMHEPHRMNYRDNDSARFEPFQTKPSHSESPIKFKSQQMIHQERLSYRKSRTFREPSPWHIIRTSGMDLACSLTLIRKDSILLHSSPQSPMCAHVTFFTPRRSTSFSLPLEHL